MIDYDKLVKAAKSVANSTGLTFGMSDHLELVSTVYILVGEGRVELPEGEVSYVSLCRKAYREVTRGTAPSRAGQAPQKYGKFVQSMGVIENMVAPQVWAEESDLREVLPLIMASMSDQGRKLIEDIRTHYGSVTAYAEATGIRRKTLSDQVHTARREFLSLIPVDCDLFITSRQMRKRYNIGGFQDVDQN